jgi:hypothetical protein
MLRRGARFATEGPEPRRRAAKECDLVVRELTRQGDSMTPLLAWMDQNAVAEAMAAGRFPSPLNAG